MTVYLTGEMHPGMVNKLFAAYETMKKKDKLNIYFSSPGGYIRDELIMRDFINNRAENITMTFCGMIASAALHLALNVQCERYMLANTIGMAHLPRVDATINANGTLADYQEDVKLWLKNPGELEEWKRLYEPLLLKKDFDKMMAGGDVLLDHKKLIQIFNKQVKLSNAKEESEGR